MSKYFEDVKAIMNEMEGISDATVYLRYMHQIENEATERIANAYQAIEDEKYKDRFTANINPTSPDEYEVYKNGEIFCHLSTEDFSVFVYNFKYHIEIKE